MKQYIAPSQVIIAPNEILLKKSRPWDFENDYDFTLLSKMMIALVSNYGVGIAAPQVGKNVRVIVVDKNWVMYNPEYHPLSESKMVEDYEGCLSKPNQWFKVKRWDKINVKYFSSLGEEKQFVVCDFMARMIQHEVDHLDGILIGE